jgi:hypothetical protein
MVTLVVRVAHQQTAAQVVQLLRLEKVMLEPVLLLLMDHQVAAVEQVQLDLM